MERWRRRHPKGDATKFNDRSTSGIPDASFVLEGRTWWIEFKLPARGQDWREQVSKIQEFKLRKMSRAGAAVYVGVLLDRGHLELWSPIAEGWLFWTRGREDEVMDEWLPSR